MPWKNGYTISDEATLPDAEVRWPEGKSCCVRVVVDLGFATSAEGLSIKDLTTSDAVFAMGEGLDLLTALLARHAIHATFAIPAMLAALYPARIQALQAMGHEIAANGLRQEDVSKLTADEERRRLDATTKMLSDITGQRPAGWFGMPRVSDSFAVGSISEATIDLLIDAGYSYFGNGLADDIPHYWVTDFSSRRALLALPHYYHCNDQYFIMYPRKGSGLENPDVLLRNWRWEFDAQYARGRHFEMTIHPESSGWGHRLNGMDRFLQYVRAKPGVWTATSSECAEHWIRTFPAASSLRLTPSVWQDHAGSMS
ncbi:MAG: polysaccharide deacetylase family protein [Pseudomonadota bacterium]